jgi:hypothetical protein
VSFGEGEEQMHWKLGAIGTFLAVMWLACWAATVVPGSSAVTMQWAAGNALAFLSGLAFGAAAYTGRGG